MKKIFKRSLLAAIVAALGETDLPAREDGSEADEKEGEEGRVAQVVIVSQCEREMCR